MTNDELLSKLLDNTLTATERQELDARMAASPQFAEEVREYLAVEEMLFKTKASLTTAPAPLLTSVEQKTAAVIATAAATTAVTGTAARSLLTGRLLAVVSTVLLGGAATWYIVTSGNTTADNTIRSVAAPTSTEQQAYQAPVSPSALPQPKDRPRTEQIPTQAGQQQVQAAQAQREVQKQTAEAQAAQHLPPVTDEHQPVRQLSDNTSVDNQNMEADKKDNTDDTKKQLSRQLDEYKAYKASGNAFGLLLAAKKVGITYRALKQFDNSRIYLEEALSLARSQHVDEEEAIVTGELGLLEKERGAVNQAEQLLQSCISKLRTLNSPQAQRWQDELTALQKDGTNK